MKLVLLFSLICLCQCVRNKDHFQVKLEPDPDRAPRLVENESDPDMVKLKNIQDKFMRVVSNTSLSENFESFQQLLSVVDSEAGIELGRLFFNGIMIGMGKENSDQILMEFWEDLQYTLSPDLVEAFKDYKDFMKGMDFQAMPAVIDMLFKQDNLGNSLAKMPLGQLVDLVQPQADKYGIDIREFVNGILGKGESKFPDLVKRLISNFNATTLLKAATGSIMKDEELLGKENQVKKREVKQKPAKESPLNMFKPFIANALKQNNIDLDVDAVIQVVTPFLDGGGEVLSQILKTFGSKDMNLAQLAPLLGLLAGSKTGRGGEPDLMQLASSFLGGDKNGPDVGMMLNLATSLLGVGGQKKNNAPSQKVKEPKVQTPDISAMLNMVTSMMGSSTTPEGEVDLNVVENIINLVSQATGQGVGNNRFLKTASGLLSTLKDTRKPHNQVEEMLLDLDTGKNDLKDPVPTNQENEKTGFETVPYRESEIIDALGNFLVDIQRNKNCHHDIKKMAQISVIYLDDKTKEAGGVRGLVQNILTAIQTFGPSDIKLSGITKAVALSEDDWADMFSLFEDQSFRDMIKLQSIEPVAGLTRELVERIVKGMFSLPNQARAVLLNLGLNDVSIDNFPLKFRDTADLISRATSLPNSLSTLFNPLQKHLNQLKKWIYQSAVILQKLPREELNELVGYTIDMDISIPVLLIRVAARASSSSLTCLPQALCEASKQMDEDSGIAVFAKKLGSLGYGLYAARQETDVAFFVDVIRASILNENCQSSFPISCPPMENVNVDYEEGIEETQQTEQTSDHDEL